MRTGGRAGAARQPDERADSPVETAGHDVRRRARRTQPLVAQPGRFTDAAESRGVIDQAKGTMMAEQRCTADEAFAAAAQGLDQPQDQATDLAAEIDARVSR